MKFLIFLSEISIPLILFYIVGFGILMKCHVYEEFVKGAKDGLLTVVKILPTLIGLMVAVGVLRASGCWGRCWEILPHKSVFLPSWFLLPLSECFPQALRQDWCLIFLKNLARTPTSD
jgi:hypothetical protein